MASNKKKELPDHEGYIALWRCIKEHWVFDDPHYFKAWVTILLEVRHKKEPKKLLLNKQVIYCNRGESLRSRDSWAALFGKGWTTQKVRTFFKLLQEDNMVNLKNERITTRLSVCNYDRWQYREPADNHRIEEGSTSPQISANSQLTTNNNGNTVENANNDNTIVYPDWLNLDLLNDFIDMRKAKKKPMTDKAIKLLIGKLDRLGIDIHESLLEDSILNGWSSVYLPDGKDQQGTSKEAPDILSKEAELKRHEENLRQDKQDRGEL